MPESFFLIKLQASASNFINPFSTSVPLIQKPGSRFLPAECLKNRIGKWVKMSLFHRCFSNILLVNTNYLVYPELEHWSEMGKKETLAQVFFCEFWEISKNTFSYITPPVDASVQRS